MRLPHALIYFKATLMGILIKVSTLFLLAGFSFAANAQAPPSGPDMRCLLVGMRFAVTPESEQKSAGLILVSYFYAKLDQTPPKELEDALAKEALDMSPSDFKFEAGRCGATIKDIAQAIKDLGANLARRRQSADAPPSTDGKSNEK
jgi:hypothetical protein